MSEREKDEAPTIYKDLTKHGSKICEKFGVLSLTTN